MGLFDGLFRRGGYGSYEAYDPIRLAHGARAFSDAFFEAKNNPHITQSNAYNIAQSLAEVAFPIDMIADRVSTLTYNIQNSSGKIVDTPPASVTRLMNKPNIWSSLTTMMYDACFILMSDGNLVGLRTRPEMYESSPLKPDNILAITLPRPHSYHIHWHRHHRPDMLGNIGDMIDYIHINEYCHRITHKGHDIEYMGNGGSFSFNNAHGYGYRSPLLTAERNINNLLIVYQARYRAYADNPMGIILSPRTPQSNGIYDVAKDRNEAKRIHDDLARRYGIAGYDVNGEKRDMWAITGVPMQAVKTLATIAELQPFEETREDAVAIAGLFDVDNSLVPSRERVSFTSDNKEAAEANLYDGIITTMANDISDFFTRLMALDKVGLKLVPDMDNVPVLQKRRLQKAQSDNLVIDLLLKMQANGLATEEEVKITADKILKNYLI
jgi:hypothetical protein